MPRGIRRRVVWAWLAVALWTAVVWTLSGDEFSAGATSRFIGPLALVVSVADETRQSFAEARTGSPRDVGLDSAGALGILAVASIWRRGRAPARRGA